MKAKEKKHSINLSSSLSRLSELVSFDNEIFEKYKSSKKSLLIGFDEVGRGCVAGPVCTAGYSCLDFYTDTHKFLRFLGYSDNFLDEEIYSLLMLDDSKKVSHGRREMLCNALLDIPSLNSANHIFYSTNFESAASIDESGIVSCIWTSMRKNLVDILEQYDNFYSIKPKQIILLIDGPRTPALDFWRDAEILTDEIELVQIPVIKGDAQSSLIAAASNLAKNHRDKHMKNLGTLTKKYAWSTNVGYGTEEHYQAINQYGLSKEHRKSFLSFFADSPNSKQQELHKE